MTRDDFRNAGAPTTKTSQKPTALVGALPKQQPYLSPLATERWRILIPTQRFAVLNALLREENRLMRLAKAARAKADRPAPYGKHQADRAITHACNAGACRIAREMLEKVGGFPE